MTGIIPVSAANNAPALFVPEIINAAAVGRVLIKQSVDYIKLV